MSDPDARRQRRMTEDCKVMLRRALELLESGKGHAAILRYDEDSDHEGELDEYRYRFEVEMVTSERFDLRLPDERGSRG